MKIGQFRGATPSLFLRNKGKARTSKHIDHPWDKAVISFDAESEMRTALENISIADFQAKYLGDFSRDSEHVTTGAIPRRAGKSLSSMWIDEANLWGKAKTMAKTMAKTIKINEESIQTYIENQLNLRGVKVITRENISPSSRGLDLEIRARITLRSETYTAAYRFEDYRAYFAKANEYDIHVEASEALLGQFNVKFYQDFGDDFADILAEARSPAKYGLKWDNPMLDAMKYSTSIVDPRMVMRTIGA